MIYALTLFLLVLPVAIINNKYYRMGFKTLFHGSPNMDSLIALGSGASLESTLSIKLLGALATEIWRW